MKDKGFTIIELLIVMTILGVLSTIAGVSFVKYIRRAKTTEVHIALERIATGAELYYRTEHTDGYGNPVVSQFPDGAGWSPNRPCCMFPGGKCPVGEAKWDKEGWTLLGFSMEGPHYYRYQFGSDGRAWYATYVIRADGDLDCDGIQSQWRRYGVIQEGFVLRTKDTVEDALE